MKNLVTRTLSGIVYVAVIVACVMLSEYSFLGLCLMLSLLGVVELTRLMLGTLRGHALVTVIDIFGAWGLIMFSFFQPEALLVLLLWLVSRLIVQLYIVDEHPLRMLGCSMMCLGYVALPISCLALLYTLFGPLLVLALFVMIWVNDTGAYLVGSSMGRHRLFERISPKKSWEGFFGGLVMAGLAGWVFYIVDPSDMGLIAWILTGLAVSILGTLGDLVESMIKRSLHVKDSGVLIPGHGGILDRIDSLLMVAPGILFFMLILNWFIV